MIFKGKEYVQRTTGKVQEGDIWQGGEFGGPYLAHDVVGLDVENEYAKAFGVSYYMPMEETNEE